MSKTAVILFNLGGPDSPKAVAPFLFSLFSDPAIITLPQPLRAAVAAFITLKRLPTALKIYKQLGGKSPIMDGTRAQAEALEKKLNRKKTEEYKTFVCMRHWHPRSSLVIKKVKAWGPDRIILLPLYPQYSTTTTGSFFADWDNACSKADFSVLTRRLCCYPGDLGFVAAHAKLIRDMYWRAAEEGAPRILFSAHGLPEHIIMEGDPYQSQVEKTVDAVVQILAVPELDYSICYQSRVGKLEWIGPQADEEILRAGEEKKPLLVVPISFVSEHSETLVELDVDYRRLADKHGVPAYWRVPALCVEPLFIEALADMCWRIGNAPVNSSTGVRVCAKGFSKCPCELPDAA